MAVPANIELISMSGRKRAVKANPFTAVIRCTCNDSIDSKTISKCARALRYAAQGKAGAVIGAVRQTLGGTPRGVRGTYVQVGQAFSWATLMLAWLMAFAVGIAIYFSQWRSYSIA